MNSYQESQGRRTARVQEEERRKTTDWAKVFAAIVAALEAYPEARAAVVRVLEEA